MCSMSGERARVCQCARFMEIHNLRPLLLTHLSDRIVIQAVQRPAELVPDFEVTNKAMAIFHHCGESDKVWSIALELKI